MAMADVGIMVFEYAQSYVALSRVRTLDGLHLMAFDPDHIFVSKAAVAEYERLRKIALNEIEPWPVCLLSSDHQAIIF